MEVRGEVGGGGRGERREGWKEQAREARERRVVTAAALMGLQSFVGNDVV